MVMNVLARWVVLRMKMEVSKSLTRYQWRPVIDDAATVQNHGPVNQGLHRPKAVSHKQDGSPLFSEFPESCRKCLLAFDVYPRGGLV
jgi:hypothetical protein